MASSTSLLRCMALGSLSIFHMVPTASSFAPFFAGRRCCSTRSKTLPLKVLSTSFLENDLVAVQKNGDKPRLCAVNPDGSVSPLCQREDDVETDLFVDPREYSCSFWSEQVTDSNIVHTFGEGMYGQRPVPSLGGGPGYGAPADEIWSVDEVMLQTVHDFEVDLPLLDFGIAHGEKARAGAF